MGKFISVGALRQNPTRMLREVRRGATYTVTDHGEPIAEITGIELRPWVSRADVLALFEDLHPDHAWSRELDEYRRGEPARDPWERSA